jgi:branched-chain amino acid transport system substrate-binding protein
MTYRIPIFSLLVFLASWLPYAAAAESQPIKVGVQLPVTGERASVGRLVVNGLQMALNDINGRNEKQALKFEITFADDKSTPEGAVEAASELAHDPRIIGIIGEINSPFVLASAPIIDKAELPYLTAGSSPRTTASSQWIFRVGASDTLLADLLAQYVVNELHMKTFAILHDRTGIHNQRAQLITSVLKEKFGIVTLADASWAPGDRSFTAQLEQIKARTPEAILAFGETPEGASFLKQVASSGLHARVVAQRDFGVKRVLDEAGAAAEGALIVTEYAPDLQGPVTQAWNAAYGNHYGGDANIIAAQYYDALMLLAEAVKTGGANRAGVKAGLERLHGFPGVVADYTFDSARNGVRRFYIGKVAEEKLSLVKILEENSGK